MLHGHINVQITKVSLCLFYRRVYKVREDYRQKGLRSSEKNPELSAQWNYIRETRGMAHNWWAGNLAYLANNKRIILFCLLPFCVHSSVPRGLKGVRFTFVAQNAHCLLGLECSLRHCWTLILLMLRDDVGRQSRWEGSKR